jgi:hypothetical protein
MTWCRVVRMGATAVVLVVVALVAVLGVLVRLDLVAALMVVGSLIAGSVASMASSGAAAESPPGGVTPRSGRASSLSAEPARAGGSRRPSQRQPVTVTVSEVVVGSATVAGLVVIAGSAAVPLTVAMALIASGVGWMGMHGGHVAGTEPTDEWPFPLPALIDIGRFFGGTDDVRRRDT